MNRNQKGFSGVELFLVLVIIAFVGYVGWYVYSVRSDTNKTYNQVDRTASTNAAKKTDPTTGWKDYSSEAGAFSLKFPSTWSMPTNPDMCTDGLLLLGGDSKSVGKCAADGPGGFGQMSILSLAGDQNTQVTYKQGEGYKDVTKKDIIVNGISGVRIEGVASGQQDGEGIPGLADGVKVVQYVFVANAHTYVASYVQQSSYPDVLKDFDTLVTKTLQFHA